MSPAVIHADRLTRRYGKTVAVDALSLDVDRGEMFGLIGPDGAGKTTTLRMVLGLIAPDAGRIETCGFDPRRQSRQLSRHVGYLSQRFSLYGDLTVDENIAFFAEIHGVRDWKGRRDELLEWVRLTPFRRRLAERLSGGMKQKLALACTLVHTPELLVLDEPTTGVDPVSRREFWKLLARLQQDGITIFLTTPYMDEAERCQRVALIHQGWMLAIDTPGALRADWPGVIVEVLARPRVEAVAALRAAAGVTDIAGFGERLHVSVQAPSAEEALPPLEAALRTRGVQMEMMRAVTPSLEDVFLARISGQHREASE